MQPEARDKRERERGREKEPLPRHCLVNIAPGVFIKARMSVLTFVSAKWLGRDQVCKSASPPIRIYLEQNGLSARAEMGPTPWLCGPM